VGEARDPFRVPDEDAVVFELRSSAFFAVGLGVMIALAVVLVPVGAWMLTAGRSWYLGLLATIAGVGAPIAMWSSRSTYTVPGGRAQLRLFDDRIELVDAHHTTVVGAADLHTHVVQHNARLMAGVLPVGVVETDRHLVIVTSGRRLVLSRRVFASSAEFERASRAIHRLAHGEPPQAEPAAKPPTGEEEEYRRRLREELDAMSRE
jgi:hypothetical protein